MTDKKNRLIIIKNIQYTFCFLLVFILYFNATSCKTETVIPPEPNKNIVGTWSIATASRNDIVLFDTAAATENPGHFNFSPFTISFNDDNTYVTSGTAPFITGSEGTWSIDQPFSKTISFVDSSGNEKSIDFYYPVTGGERQLIITFSPGCNKNIYKYTLERIN